MNESTATIIKLILVFFIGGFLISFLILNYQEADAHHIYNEPPFITFVLSPSTVLIDDEWFAYVKTVDYIWKPRISNVTVIIEAENTVFMMNSTTTKLGELTISLPITEENFGIHQQYNYTIITESYGEVQTYEDNFWTIHPSKKYINDGTKSI